MIYKGNNGYRLLADKAGNFTDITPDLREVLELLRAQCEECQKSLKWNNAECIAKYSCRDGIAATMLSKILEVE